MSRAETLPSRLSASARLFLLILVLFAPLAAQGVATSLQHYGAGLALRIASHIVVPVLAVMYIRRLSLRDAALLPVKPAGREGLHWSLRVGALGSGLVAVGLVVAYLTLGRLVDWDAVRMSLWESYGVQPVLFPIVAFAIIAINPIMEEYFWRGFIYRAFRDNTESPRLRRAWLYLTGIFFALHHVLIIQGWFNWWQWLLTVVVLAVVGIVFNWLYERTESIIAPWLIHTAADAAIILIGFHIFGYI